MGIIDGVVLIVMGGLCLPGMVAKKSPNAKELLDKVVPFQGWLGLVAFVWGVYGVIMSIVRIGLIGTWPLGWVTGLGGNILNLAAGAILGFGMIQKIILSKAPEAAKAKAEEGYQKLVGMQSKLGIACLICGLWVLVYTLLLRGMLKI